jgi:Uma2 family endonuclease
MDKKLLFYDRYGVEEYYIYDPDRNTLSGWLRAEDGLEITLLKFFNISALWKDD